MAARQVVRLQGGSLRFEFAWPAPSRSDACDGWLSVFLDETPIWGKVDKSGQFRGVAWDWIELLEHLASYWPHLIYGQGFPCNLSPSRMSELDGLLEQRWADACREWQDAEEDRVAGFRAAHDLAEALPGCHLSSLWLVRDGGEFLVEGGACGTRRFIADVEIKAVLGQVGDHLAGRLQQATDDRAHLAMRCWRDRNLRSPKESPRIVTGLADDYLSEFDESDFADEFCRDVDENVFLDVAYRCKGLLPREQLRQVFRFIRQWAPSSGSGLAAWLAQTRTQLETWEADGLRPFQEGHRLAMWLRQQPQIADPNGRVDPERLLASWGVTLQEYSFGTNRLDAIACWGKGRGVGILWNSHEKHRANAGARRATLAHEVCHVLVDRGSGLPLSAVAGGAMHRHLEQRANAFAAELLCPRQEASATHRSSSGVEQTVRILTQRFGVSEELASLQLARSGLHFDRQEQQRIEELVPPNATLPWN